MASRLVNCCHGGWRRFHVRESIRIANARRPTRSAPNGRSGTRDTVKHDVAAAGAVTEGIQATRAIGLTVGCALRSVIRLAERVDAGSRKHWIRDQAMRPSWMCVEIASPLLGKNADQFMLASIEGSLTGC